MVNDWRRDVRSRGIRYFVLLCTVSALSQRASACNAGLALPCLAGTINQPGIQVFQNIANWQLSDAQTSSEKLTRAACTAYLESCCSKFAFRIYMLGYYLGSSLSSTAILKRE